MCNRDHITEDLASALAASQERVAVLEAGMRFAIGVLADLHDCGFIVLAEEDRARLEQVLSAPKGTK